MKYFITYASTIPARDRVIDFGKYKGKMLGTLPSTYLKWVSKTLRARDFEEWANLADQVLQDPVYNDRLEWEFAEKLLNGDVNKSNGRHTVAELLDVSHRFGWDNDDKVGWSKVDFQLLGTSKGGRIPRVKGDKEERKSVVESKRAEVEDGERKRGVGERRVERRERLRMKRGMLTMDDGFKDVNGGDGEGRKCREGLQLQGSCEQIGVVYSPFPGRDALLRKALNRERHIGRGAQNPGLD